MTYNDQSDTSPQSGSSMMSGLTGAGRETLENVRTQAMDAVSRTTEAARAQAMGQAESAKDTLADTGERLAQSLRGAVEGGDDSIQAKLMAAAADSITEFSSSLRGRSLNDLWGQAESFARRNPGAFVAAAALAGFALARFARASSTSSHDSQYGGSQFGGSPYGSQSGAMGGGSMGSGYGSSGLGASSSFGTGSGMGSGLGSGGDYAGSGAFGAGTGTGYGAGRVQGGHVSTSGMTTHGDDLDDGTMGADALTEDTMGSGMGLGGGMGGGSSAGTGGTGDMGSSGTTGSDTPNSSRDASGTGYDRGTS